MNTRQQRMYRTEGSLALTMSISRESFRVLEGGRGSSQTRRDATESCSGRYGAAFAVLAIVLTLFGSALVQEFLHERCRAELLDRVAYETVIVHSGATLWQIAEEHPLEGCSTTEQVATIREINHLSSADLQVGMELQVPVDM